MKCKIFLPYISFDESKFSVNDNYYSGNEYENALKLEYERTSEAVNAYTSNSLSNMQYSDRNLEYNKIDAPSSYSLCEGEVLNEYGKPETVDSLVTYAAQNNDVVVMLMKFDFDTMDEDFETDLKLWIESHNNVNKQTNVTNEWKFMNEPKRTILISFPNLKNDEIFLELSNCKLLEAVGNNGYAILIERVNFSKGL